MFKNGIASAIVNSQQANIAKTFSPVWAFKKSYRANRQGKVILAEQFQQQLVKQGYQKSKREGEGILSVKVATFSDQLIWIIFCNRCGLVLYRAQTKSEHGLYFPLGRRFLNAINNTMPLLSTGAGTKYRKQLTRQQVKDHPVQNFHRDLSSLRVFIELTGAGAIGKALAFFKIQNIRNNFRVNKSRIF